MSTIQAYHFPIVQASNIFPDHFFVSEAGPAVAAGLAQEGGTRSAAGGDEEGFARHRVVVCRFFLTIDVCEIRSLLRFFEKTRGLGVMTVEAAYSIR
jgi:hypothetical protein